MKKLPVPAYDDFQAIRAASASKRMGSYPYLKDELNEMVQAYTNYIADSGNVLLVTKTHLSKDLTDALKVHYASEPKSFNFIGKLRASSPAVCPMCGSLNTGTLDHLFPQEHFPEYAVLSKNLVPACDCNTKRKDIYKGVDAAGGQVRVLHPYFDDCFQNRLIYYRILPKNTYPLAEFSLQYINSNNALHQSINQVSC